MRDRCWQHRLCMVRSRRCGVAGQRVSILTCDAHSQSSVTPMACQAHASSFPLDCVDIEAIRATTCRFPYRQRSFPLCLSETSSQPLQVGLDSYRIPQHSVRSSTIYSSSSDSLLSRPYTHQAVNSLPARPCSTILTPHHHPSPATHTTSPSMATPHTSPLHQTYAHLTSSSRTQRPRTRHLPRPRLRSASMP